MNYFDLEELVEISIGEQWKGDRWMAEEPCWKIRKDSIEKICNRKSEIFIENYRDEEYGMIRLFCHHHNNELRFEFYDPLLKERKKVLLKQINQEWIDHSIASNSFVGILCWERNAIKKIEEIIKNEKELLSLINRHNKKQCQRPFKIMPDYVLVGNYPKNMKLYMPKLDKLMFRCKGKTVSQKFSQYDAKRYFETYDDSIINETEREYYRSHNMREDISWCLG